MLFEIFKKANESVFEGDLFPASLIQTIQDKEQYEEKIGETLLLFEDVQRSADIIGCDPSHIYFSEKGFETYYYYNFPALVPLASLNPEELAGQTFWADRYNQQITARYNTFTKLIDSGDFVSLFQIIDPSTRILFFTKLYSLIPDNLKYQLFADIYTSVEYGFSGIPEDIVQDILSKGLERNKETILQKLNSVFPGDEITIYRGQHHHSTSIDKAISWTLSFEVASRFASFYTGEGDVFCAKIKKEHVIDYIQDRNEEEILVIPNKLYDLKNMDMVKLSEEFEEMLWDTTFSAYSHYTNLIDETWFHKPDGIHGTKHTQRVLFHAISLARALDLDDFDIHALSVISLFHDVGRTNDEEDPTHGDASWEKVNDLDLLHSINHYYGHQLDEPDIQLIEFIIRNHCLDDKTAMENLNQFEHPEKDRIKLLYNVFCDSDSLDRVRFRDLDVSYLRLEESKRRVNLAFGLLRNTTF